MFVHRSNRVEELFDAMAHLLAEPLADPFEAECIVVPSRGLGTWVSMRLSERFGVWAGADFPFPRRFLHRMFELVLGRSDPDGFTAERLLWPILAELPALLERPGFAELAHFVAQDATLRNTFALAQRIALIFDQYTVFRPDLVLAWESGRDEHWQAELWRALVARLGSGHPAALARDFIAALESGAPLPRPLPSRVCVFGVTTLPPLYVQLLAAVGLRCPVHMFVLSPSREYWAELRSHREALRDVERGHEVDAREDHGPTLLASLGGVGRDFQAVLESTVDYREFGPERYVDPGEDSMLAALQSDLLHLRRREPATRRPLAPDDVSIAVHACHSPMREVEVLHDQLLDAFERDPTLRAEDVVVMMSDLETYAPLVEAVFERDPQDPSYIPYAVADRSLRSDSPTIEALHRILALVGTRVTASSVLDLLTLEPVATKFGISAEDVDTLTAWVTESGIRWGIDAGHRRQHGQPELPQNTWRFGLERLLLGYAMPGRGVSTFRDVLPFDELEGQETQLLGQLAELCEILFTASTRLVPPRPLVAWRQELTQLIEQTLEGPERNAWEIQRIRTALDELVAEAGAAGFDGDLELPNVLALLSERMEEERPHRAFLAGGVTFCAMLPMRSVPFRVVCLLGLGDEQFPRRSTSVSFDLVAQKPRRGDRSRRGDDRYLFLEALLAARERLLLFYVGQSIQDNSELPPSVVVNELLEAVTETFRPRADGTPIAAGLVVRHPMQPFSPRYFGADRDPRLFSYASSFVAGARALQDASLRLEVAPLLVERLPAVEFDDGTELPLTHLVRFFRQPAADLLKRRLGVYLDEWQRDRSDREPMELGDLERWRVGDTLLRHQLEGRSPDEAFTLLKASGALPLGVVGRCKFEDLRATVDPIVDEAKRIRDAAPLPDLAVDVRVARNRLVGVIGSRWPLGVCQVQYGRVRAKHILAAWIHHLALCLVAPEDQRHETVLIGRNEKKEEVTMLHFRAVPDARAQLENLVELYWQGLREPLLLFPRTSYAFCERFKKKFDAADALRSARKVWVDRPGRGERDDPYLRRLFGERDVLDPGFRLFDDGKSFVELAVSVFGPLLQALDGNADDAQD